MTTPTTTPIPSTQPVDLLFNAEKMDEVINSGAPTYADRFGQNRMTVAGMGTQAQTQLAGIASQAQTQLATIASQAQAQAASIASQAQAQSVAIDAQAQAQIAALSTQAQAQIAAAIAQGLIVAGSIIDVLRVYVRGPLDFSSLAVGIGAEAARVTLGSYTDPCAVLVTAEFSYGIQADLTAPNPNSYASVGWYLTGPDASPPGFVSSSARASPDVWSWPRTSFRFPGQYESFAAMSEVFTYDPSVSQNYAALSIHMNSPMSRAFMLDIVMNVVVVKQ